MDRSALQEAPLLIAIGNDSRGDDGLAWALALRLENSGAWPGPIEYRYQLQIEDAELIAAYRQVLFVDATQEPGDWLFRYVPLAPSAAAAFSTHRLEPAEVLYWCRELYGRLPEAHLLAIRGYSWELGEGLSEKGAEVLGKWTPKGWLCQRPKDPLCLKRGTTFHNPG